jgi:multidrug efflux pump subunit AcrB
MKRLIIWMLISAFVHASAIILSSLLPTLLTATEELQFTETETEMTKELATEEEDEENEEEEKELIIDKDNLNIDVVSRYSIDKHFSEDIAKELQAILKIKEVEEKQREQENQEQIQLETNEAIQGINVINTYPLQAHANVILEHFDFSKPFEAEIGFRVNSDGSFRGIAVERSTGVKVVDKSLENIFYELSEQKVAFFTNFRKINASFISDGSTLTFTLTAYFKDDLNAMSIHSLLSILLKSAKENNKDDKETMTLLNNLTTERKGNALLFKIIADTMFVKEAIKD